MLTDGSVGSPQSAHDGCPALSPQTTWREVVSVPPGHTAIPEWALPSFNPALPGPQALGRPEAVLGAKMNVLHRKCISGLRVGHFPAFILEHGGEASVCPENS